MLNVTSAALALAARFKSGGIIVNEHTLTRDETRSHVEALHRHFDFIHLNDLPARLKARGKKPFCLLTFDDGKRSNATVTALELERLGVPAVFFVVTGFLGTDKALWFDRYRLLQNKGAVPAGLSARVIKQLPHDLLAERIERACCQHDVAIDPNDEDVVAMTWDHARSLHGRGFAIGAHGVTHAIMTRETKAEAFKNIAASIERVSAETGEPCRSFAFPNGTYTAELARHAMSCGAQTVMTTEPTWADQSFPLWRLPRIQLFGPQSRARIELKVAASAMGRILENPDGTGRVYCAVNRFAKMSSKKSIGAAQAESSRIVE
jgi:peptidoglycan/xylan/chitin deacetylase (PgdA/CDA1 family)